MSKFLATFVIPVHNREQTIDRCLNSILTGGISTKLHSYEIVVIDDASTDGTKQKLDKWKKKLPYNLNVLTFKDHMERIYGFNAGMMQAQGEWIIRLDSDDELTSHFKQAFEDAITLHPEAMILNWGSVLHWRNKDGKYHRSSIRQPYQLAVEPTTGQCQVFKSGGINSGSFAFKKVCLNFTGYLPQAKDPYTFGKKMKSAHREIAQLYGTKDDLGNPFGDDYAMYFKLTRHWMPITLDQNLHIQHVRQ